MNETMKNENHLLKESLLNLASTVDSLNTYMRNQNNAIRFFCREIAMKKYCADSHPIYDTLTPDIKVLVDKYSKELLSRFLLLSCSYNSLSTENLINKVSKQDNRDKLKDFIIQHM